jgi:hypothetical protein
MLRGKRTGNRACSTLRSDALSEPAPSGVATGCHMDWVNYLRDEATKYRQLAEGAKDQSIKQELLDLAAVCEEAANDIEDRMPGG